jgi:hypothetical protein
MVSFEAFPIWATSQAWNNWNKRRRWFIQSKLI